MKVRANKGRDKRLRTVKALVKYGCEKQNQDHETGANCAQPETPKLQGCKFGE